MSVMHPTILAIETATPSCSVALLHDDKVTDLQEVGRSIHSKVLLSMIDRLLSQAQLTASDLNAVAVSQGPGSFTGLRIGIGAAQGIAYGAACPMLGVSSLEALAQSALSFGQQGQPTTVLAGIDARMGEIYWAEFTLDKHAIRLVGELRVTPPEHVVCSQPIFSLLGNAWPEYQERLSEEVANVEQSCLYPQASMLLALARLKYENGETINAADFAPIYVRNDVAKKSTKPLPGKRA